MFSCKAPGLFSTTDSAVTPHSVKAFGALRFPPRFFAAVLPVLSEELEVLNWHFKLTHSRVES
jgi:hypothetical protein